MQPKRLYRLGYGQRPDLGPSEVAPTDPSAEDFVRDAEIGQGWLHPEASNYTFVVELTLGGRKGFGVYKPQSGEAPLWDFPTGSLYRRECATYELSRLFRWPLVPPTLVREGELGVGSLQLYTPQVPDSNYFTLRETHRDEALRMAVFDLVANNADRKGGHCFVAECGGVWGVDHGLTFHTQPKLRTVIWDFAGEPVPEPLLEDLRRVSGALGSAAPGEAKALASFITAEELEVTCRRIAALLEHPAMPEPYSRRDVPWSWL